MRSYGESFFLTAEKPSGSTVVRFRFFLLTPPAWISKQVWDLEAPVSQIFSPLNTFLVLLM